jgi:hypothetical protein
MKSPITPAKVALGGLREIFWTPLTWVPLVPSMGIVAFCTLPWWANAGLILTPSVIIAGYWVRFWPRISNVVKGKLLLEKQQSDDADLRQLTDTMSNDGYHKESKALTKAKDVLAQISELNQSDSNPTAQALRIEAVAQDIYNQMLEKARSLRDKPDEDCLASFQQSLKTMQDSFVVLQRQAEVIKNMANATPEDKLAQLEKSLRTENTIANQVIDRVQGDTKLSE